MRATTTGRGFGAFWLLVTGWLLAWSAPALAQGPGPDPRSVPDELRPWMEWVREQESEPGDCRSVDDTLICIWPTNVAFVLDEDGGNFSLEVTAHGDDSVELPGDDEAWPQEVTVDGRPALVKQSGGVPYVELESGRHRVEGRYAWREFPDGLLLPEEYAIVELVVAGTSITFPTRTDGYLDIPVPDTGEEPEPEPEPEPEEDPDAEPEPDSEQIDVSRLVADGVPLAVTTRIDLRISGSDRELTLPYPLWKDAKLLRIDSGLPVSLGDDRSLKIKARSGTYEITLIAQLPRAPETLGPPALAEPWPTEEVWVWNAKTGPEAKGLPSMGQVALTGGTPVDRTRTHAPSSWPEGATYKVTTKTPLKFEVLQRGVSETASSELALVREAVLDLDGRGWFLSDTIAGTLQGTSRLDLPGGSLGSVLVDDVPQVITVNSEGHPGVELRRPDVRLRAQWRDETGSATIPLAGWSEEFEHVSLEFRLPRGWDILRASGPGRMSDTWVDRWRNPLDVVLMLLCCVAVGLWVDWRVAAVTLVGLVLVYAPSDDAFIALLVLVGGLAGLKKLMERELSPWLAWAVRSAWMLGAFLLVTWVVLFLPDGLERVWTEGAPVFGDIRFERAFETLFGFGFAAVLLAGLTTGVSWGVGRLRGVSPRLIVPGIVVVFVLVLGFAFVQSAGEMSPDGALATKSAPQGAAEAPPPPPVEEMMEEEAAFDDDEASGAKEARDEARAYAMKATSKQKAPMRHKGEEGEMGYAAADAPADEDVWGGLDGTEVGEAYGVGGLGLVGTGRGGGGTGEGTIGLGNTGLIGKGGGGGTGSGYGSGSGAGFGGQGKRVPRVRQGAAAVTGSLDKDIVRRIVRAHINEVRACYNQGLSRNADLSGRVAVAFTIGADGKVSSSTVESSTTGDAAVDSCIANAVKRWKFPNPQGGGTVNVTYPFSLDPGDGQGPGGEAPAEPTRYVDNEDLPEAPPPEIPQTGEARPDWTGRVWTVEVDRRVEQGEELSLSLLSPTANKLIALIRALALAALAVAMVRIGWPVMRRPHGSSSGKSSPGAKAAAAAVAALLWLGSAGIAQAAPPQELLDELANRVNAEPQRAPSPDCGQDCALVPKLAVDADPDGLRIDVELHMAGPGVYALPGSIATWTPSRVLVNKKSATALVARNGRLLLHVPEGVHEVSLSGPVAGEALNLALSTAPKRVEVQSEGWTVTGVDDNDRATNLQLIRNSGDATGPDPEQPPDATIPDDPNATEQPTDASKTSQDLPVWLSVERHIQIGPRWTMRTTVRRLNEGPSPVTIKIPMLKGEKMIESSEKIDDPKATVTLDQNGDVVTWTSVLDTREELSLAAPKADQWTETWLFECGAAWQCDATGLPATRRDGALSVYHPWPQEALKVALFKPVPAEGPRLSVDAARLDLSLGDTGTHAVLNLEVRTSTVGERTITLPEGAHLDVVEVDGTEVPTGKDTSEVRLTFQPGAHDVKIEWKQDDGFSSSYATPEIQLGGEAINARVSVRFDDDRDPVLLWTSGDGRGPTVWLWAWVAALAGVALFMQWMVRGRGDLDQQVRLHDWFLLGLGFHVFLLPVVFAWFLVVGQRRDLTKTIPGDPSGDRRYNSLQMVTVLVTLLVVLIALVTARELLTERVDTMVENLFSGTTLSWYVDRTDGAMPRGRVLSMHAGLWRALWIGWVVWFGWRAYHWGKWAYGEVAEGGWLRWPPPPVAGETPDTYVAQVPSAKPDAIEGADAPEPNNESSEPSSPGGPTDDPASADDDNPGRA